MNELRITEHNPVLICSVCGGNIQLGREGYDHLMPHGFDPIAWQAQQRAFPCWTKAIPKEEK